MRRKTLKVSEQRRQQEHNIELSVRLYFHLRALRRAILQGDSSKLVEFQQWVQYATPEMKALLLED